MGADHGNAVSLCDLSDTCKLQRRCGCVYRLMKQNRQLAIIGAVFFAFYFCVACGAWIPFGWHDTNSPNIVAWPATNSPPNVAPLGTPHFFTNCVVGLTNGIDASAFCTPADTNDGMTFTNGINP